MEDYNIGLKMAIAKTKKYGDISKNMYSREVVGVADNEFVN